MAWQRRDEQFELDELDNHITEYCDDTGIIERQFAAQCCVGYQLVAASGPLFSLMHTSLVTRALFQTKPYFLCRLPLQGNKIPFFIARVETEIEKAVLSHIFLACSHLQREEP